jgi:hypothetical protein
MQMLGRKDYAKEELEAGRSAMREQTAAYRKLAKAIDGGPARRQLEDFEQHFFNNMVLALDRFYVHRVRPVAGKDGNPLNEVELIADSLMANDGTMRSSKVIAYVPAESVLKLEVGERIALTAKDFDRLSSAFFDELERRFVAKSSS